MTGRTETVFFDEEEAGLPAVKVEGRSRSRRAESKSQAEERPARNKKDDDAVQIIFPKQGGYITIPASSYPTVIDFYNRMINDTCTMYSVVIQT